MPDMTSVKNDVHFSLFKGEPGTRKSTAALTYPKPMYWISFDQKMNALTIPMKRWEIDPKQIHFDDFTSWPQARTKIESFIFGTSLNASDNTFPYKTVVLDSITTCADYMLRDLIQSKKGDTRKSGKEAGRTIGGIPVNEMDDFNAESAGLTEMIALTKQLHKTRNIDVILIAHVIRTDQKTPEGKQQISRVIVTAGKKPAAKIPAYCDETYHFGVEESLDASKPGIYTVYTSNVGEESARTTLDLPTKIEMEGENLYEKWIKPAIIKQQAK